MAAVPKDYKKANVCSKRTRGKMIKYLANQGAINNISRFSYAIIYIG